MATPTLITRFFILALLLCSGCVEPIIFDEVSFESVLVIDATITNEEKNHQIFISRTYALEEDGPNPVSNANVRVQGGGTEYIFEEIQPGIYSSSEAFSAQPLVDYQLFITTSNGQRYSSENMQLTASTQIDALYAVRETNDDGVDGMSLYVDSFDSSGQSRYYRYEFEETFKIIAPEFVDMDLQVAEPFNLYTEPCGVRFTSRPDEQKICYRTEYSNFINLTSTAAFTEDRVSRFLVRFLNGDDYKISHRYSLLAKQFVLSEAGYNYKQTILNFANEGSLFSQIQAGYVGGNINSESNSSEKVIGFFEVSSVSEKRVYFNYADYFPNQNLPPYVISCLPSAPKRFDSDGSCGFLLTAILSGSLRYVAPNNGEFPMGGPYLMVSPACGDCTVLGSSDPPDFWIE